MGKQRALSKADLVDRIRQSNDQMFCPECHMALVQNYERNGYYCPNEDCDNSVEYDLKGDAK